MGTSSSTLLEANNGEPSAAHHSPLTTHHSPLTTHHRSLPLLRWTALLGLLVVEVLFVTLRYDTGTLEEQTQGWAEVLNSTPFWLQLAITMLFALLILGGGRLRGELRWLAHELQTPSSPWGWLPVHLAAFAAFVLTTRQVLWWNDGPPWSQYAWLAAWLLFGLATLVCWAGMVLPLALWGRLARRQAGLLVLAAAVGAAAWAAGRFTDQLWEPLAASTFDVVQALLRLGYNEIVCDPERWRIGTPAFAVTIAPECSGYEGIGLVWVFLGVYLWAYRSELRFPAALLLLPAGTVAVWLANAVRIAALIAVGTSGSREVALGGFHSQAGCLAFNVIVLGLIAVAQRLPWFARATDAPRSSATVAYLAPLMTILAVTMLTGMFTGGFDWLYPLRVVAAVAVLALCWRHYGDWQWTWSWSAVAVGVGVFVLWLALEPFASPAVASAGPVTTPTNFWWLFFRIAGAVLTVPLAEELAFRAYLTRRLIAADFQEVPPGRFRWFSFLLSSLLFGLLHQQRWVAGTVAGMMYALVYYRRGQVADAVLAHAVTNALLAAYVLTTGTWSLW